MTSLRATGSSWSGAPRLESGAPPSAARPGCLGRAASVGACAVSRSRKVFRGPHDRDGAGENGQLVADFPHDLDAAAALGGDGRPPRGGRLAMTSRGGGRAPALPRRRGRAVAQRRAAHCAGRGTGDAAACVEGARRRAGRDGRRLRLQGSRARGSRARREPSLRQAAGFGEAPHMERMRQGNAPTVTLFAAHHAQDSRALRGPWLA